MTYGLDLGDTLNDSADGPASPMGSVSQRDVESWNATSRVLDCMRDNAENNGTEFADGWDVDGVCSTYDVPMSSIGETGTAILLVLISEKAQPERAIGLMNNWAEAILHRTPFTLISA